MSQLICQKKNINREAYGPGPVIINFAIPFHPMLICCIMCSGESILPLYPVDSLVLPNNTEIYTPRHAKQPHNRAHPKYCYSRLCWYIIWMGCTRGRTRCTTQGMRTNRWYGVNFSVPTPISNYSNGILEGNASIAPVTVTPLRLAPYPSDNRSRSYVKTHQESIKTYCILLSV